MKYASVLPKHIPWPMRLEARVLMGLALIAALCLTAVVVATDRVVSDHAMERSRADLLAARDAFYNLEQTQAGFAAQQCRLIVELPIFRKVLNSDAARADRATIDATASEYAREISADFMVVADTSGRWLGSAGWEEGLPVPEALTRSMSAALGESDGSVERIVPFENGQLYLIVTQKAQYAEEVLATVTVGYRLDNRTAQQLASISHCQVTFLNGDRAGGSSLTREERFALRSRMRSSDFNDRLTKGLEVLQVDHDRYVAGIFPIQRDMRGAGPRLLLMQDWEPTHAFQERIRWTLFGVGALAFALALAVGDLFSRRVTRPLADLAATAEQIGSGSWEHRVPVRGSVEAVAMAEAFNRMTDRLREYYDEVHARSEELQDALAELQKTYGATLEALSRALDTRDNETEGHSLRVTYYAMRLGEQLGIDDEQREILRLGSMLHDIGKIGVPDAILRKPGPLDADEMAVMRRHCEFGLEIVRGIPYLEGASVVIRYHHERFDGKGYPYGLPGSEIPLVARIFAVVDTLDAITSDRPYRRARPFLEALREIRSCSGSQFDPEVVRALELLIDELCLYRAEHASASAPAGAVRAPV